VGQAGARDLTGPRSATEPGTGVVVLVDPGTTPAPEIQAAIDLLSVRPKTF